MFIVDENKIKEYVLTYNDLFNIKDIQTIRDGGTIAIGTNSKTYPIFYSDKDLLNIYYGYPTSERYLVKEELLLYYLFERIHIFLIRKEESLVRQQNLFEKLKQNIKII